jgi:hypothetical protein
MRFLVKKPWVVYGGTVGIVAFTVAMFFMDSLKECAVLRGIVRTGLVFPIVLVILTVYVYRWIRMQDRK